MSQIQISMINIQTKIYQIYQLKLKNISSNNSILKMKLRKNNLNKQINKYYICFMR